MSKSEEGVQWTAFHRANIYWLTGLCISHMLRDDTVTDFWVLAFAKIFSFSMWVYYVVVFYKSWFTTRRNENEI